MVVMSNWRRGMRAGGCAFLVAVTSACGPAGGGTSAEGGTSAAAGGPSVVAALYPLAFVVERIGGPDASVQSLAAPGVEPHDLELSPRQVGDIADAALVLYLRGFAPAVDEAVEQNAAEHNIDVSTVVDLHSTGGSDGSGAGGPDPHFWLDPVLLGGLAEIVGARLGELDPGHADDFTERAGALVDDLEDLDATYASGLADCATRTLVTSHDAFGYLSARYGLDQVSIAGLEPDAEPSAARITEVQNIVRSSGTTTIFFEPLASSAVAESIATDLGVASASLDPVESPPEAGDYLTVMTANLAALRAGLRCD